MARCIVQRLTCDSGLRGVVRGKGYKTIIADEAALPPADLVNGQFAAARPNQLWVADFTYVATWRGPVFVAFVINVFSRMIVGSRVNTSMKTDFVLGTLEQALHARGDTEELIHNSDRESQYLSIRYDDRLAESGIKASVGSTGDSYNNALAELINGLYKAEVTHRRGPLPNVEDVNFATLKWIDSFNSRHLLEPIGNVPPV